MKVMSYYEPKNKSLPPAWSLAYLLLIKTACKAH